VPLAPAWSDEPAQNVVKTLGPALGLGVTLLLGTLAGMASSVVAYWVGSSNGSMQKNAALEKVLRHR
jgi:hypothetical protein